MKVKVPSMGEGGDSATIVSILVSEGDSIQKEDDILELESDKANFSVPSPKSGTVGKIQVAEGDTISVGDTILELEEDADDGGEQGDSSDSKSSDEDGPADKQDSKQGSADDEASEDSADDSSGGDGADDDNKSPSHAPASPSVQKMAHQLGIDLEAIRRQKSDDRVTIEDLRDYIKELESKSGKPSGPDKLPDFTKFGEVCYKPLSDNQKRVAGHMTKSWQTLPLVTQFDEADITRLMEIQAEASGKQEGGEITLTAFLIKLVVAVLQEHALFNASLDTHSDQIVLKDYYHIGIATDTDSGLLVPVIRDVHRKSLAEIARELNETVEQARKGELSGECFEGASFTISNQGALGGTHFTPLVNLPESAILGLGQAREKPAVVDGEIVKRTILPLSVSYDHRVANGADAARFVKDLVKLIEQCDDQILGS